MKPSTFTLIALAVALALTGAAEAAVLLTPPLVQDGTSQLMCGITNVSAQDRTVRIEVFDSFATEVGDSGELDLPPLNTRFVLVGIGVAPRLCRFTVEGAKTNFRASGCILQDDVGCTAAVSAE